MASTGKLKLIGISFRNLSYPQAIEDLSSCLDEYLFCSYRQTARQSLSLMDGQTIGQSVSQIDSQVTQPDSHYLSICFIVTVTTHAMLSNTVTVRRATRQLGQSDRQSAR